MPARFGIASMSSKSVHTFIVNETCEGTGTPAGWTDATSPGNINWDYSATPLSGSQSLYLTIASTTGLTRVEFTDISEVWVYFLFKLTNGSAPAGTRSIGGISASGAAVSFQSFGVTTALRATFSTASPATALVIDAIYHVWLHYRQGTGADAVSDCAFSTNGVRPTSGSNFAQLTTGTSTNLVGRLTFGTGATNVNFDAVYDNIKVSASQIGDSGS